MYIIISVLAPLCAIVTSDTIFTSHPVDQVDTELISKDWPLFIAKYCGHKCQNGFHFHTQNPYHFITPGCIPCDCDENCSLNGTCCPTFDYDGVKSSYEIENSVRLNYFNKVYKCKYPPMDEGRQLKFVSRQFVTVVKCPKTWSVMDITKRCENPDKKSLGSITPFTDHKSGLVFTNIFCALCHGLVTYSTNYSHAKNITEYYIKENSQLGAWPLHIECDSYQNVFHITDRFKLYEKVAKLRECKFNFNETKSETECRGAFANFRIASPSCQWHTAGILRKLCHNLPAIQALRVTCVGPFFCFLCNGSDLNEEVCVPIDYTQPKDYPPIVLLFSASRQPYENEDVMREIGCLADQWVNDKGQCISGFCPTGKVLVNGEACETAIKDIRGLEYSLDVTLVFETSFKQYEEACKHVSRSVEETLKSFRSLDVFDITIQCRVYDSFHSSNHYIATLDITGLCVASLFSLRDDFESEMIDILTNSSSKIQLIHTNSGKEVITLQTVCLGEELCGIYRIQSHYGNCYSSQGNRTVGTRDGFSPFSYHANLDVACPFYQNSTRIKQGKSNRSFITYPRRKDYSNSNPVQLTPDIICLYATLNQTQGIIVDEYGSIIFTIELRKQSLRLAWDANMSVVDGEFRLCLSLLKDMINQIETRQRKLQSLPKYYYNYIFILINYYMDIVCISISCICLLATIITYLLFKSLHSLAGINNVCLCFSLLTAQVCLLVTTLFGAGGHLTKLHCLIHAIILHYSWITSFVWMNTCCIHMFRVFRGHRMKSQRREFLWYCIYSFGLPLTVVATTMTISTILTKGASIGYDFDVCFLDIKISSLIMILGLLTPLVLTVLINGFLFIMTIREIVLVTRMQKQHKSSPGVITYVKLSTVTGAFCFFAAAAVQLEIPFVSLIASPFAALQGVFIFTSFIANKRVLKLYDGLICRRSKDESDSAHSTTKSTQ